MPGRRSGLWSWNVRMRLAVSSTDWIDSRVRSRACRMSVWASRIRRRVGLTFLFYEMPGAGIEPARSLWDLRILSPMRLPVPPPRRASMAQIRAAPDNLDPQRPGTRHAIARVRPCGAATRVLASWITASCRRSGTHMAAGLVEYGHPIAAVYQHCVRGPMTLRAFGASAS